LNVQRKEKGKTVLRTIRIDKELDDALYNDAQENDINENALISSILVKYIEWDRYAKKIGRVTLPKEALKSIIESRL
jgi:ribosomal protein L25 (general stress protein Ctc)